MKWLKYQIFVVLSLILLLSGCGGTSRPYRIGVVNFLPQMNAVLDGFKDGMATAGYIEGEDVEYIYNGPAPSLDDLDEIALDLVENQDVDMLLAFSTAASIRAFQAAQGTDIPVVFVPVTDPKGAGLVNSLSEPGMNATGITNGGSVLKRFEWLIRIDPNLSKVYVPYNPEDGSAVSAIDATEEAATSFDLTIIRDEVRSEEEIPMAIAGIPDDVDGIVLMPDILMISNLELFLAEAIDRQILFTSVSTSSADRGAIMTFGLDFFESGKQASRLAEQIIQGTPPADLPVETAEFFLNINLKTAEAVGLEISDEILDQADEIIR